MSGGILDSSVLIDCVRGRANAIAFLAAQSTITRPSTHLLVVAELLTGARDKGEQRLIDSFLQAFDLALPNEADGLTALEVVVRRCGFVQLKDTIDDDSQLALGHEH